MTRSEQLSRRPHPRRLALIIAAAVVALAVVITGAMHGHSRSTTSKQQEPSISTVADTEPSIARARAILGTPRSGERWLSGIWAGGATASAARTEEFGRWRGEPVDAVTTYPAYRTWAEMSGSAWNITTFASFPGTLIYGLPMLPTNDTGSFATILAGRNDAVFTKIAHDLIANGRGRSIVRIGWEANGDWFPWRTTAGQAAQYRAAFRHIVAVLHATAPDLIIDFDIGCGVQLKGQHDRMDALKLLYPGDDVVDLIGCDTYDWYTTTTSDDASWQRTLHPTQSAGLADVAEFAREHGKGMSVPEWGLASPQEHGLGDNPLFIKKMRGFFEANADVLILESYFSEPETSLANSIWDPDQNPKSAQVYADLW